MIHNLKKVEPLDRQPSYYIQFGQYTHPMGSGRSPWAAGEYNIVTCQALPVLVKKANQMCGSFLLKILCLGTM